LGEIRKRGCRSRVEYWTPRSTAKTEKSHDAEGLVENVNDSSFASLGIQREEAATIRCGLNFREIEEERNRWEMLFGWGSDVEITVPPKKSPGRETRSILL